MWVGELCSEIDHVTRAGHSNNQKQDSFLDVVDVVEVVVVLVVVVVMVAEPLNRAGSLNKRAGWWWWWW